MRGAAGPIHPCIQLRTIKERNRNCYANLFTFTCDRHASGFKRCGCSYIEPETKSDLSAWVSFICRIISNVGVPFDVVLVSDGVGLQEPAEDGDVTSRSIAVQAGSDGQGCLHGKPFRVEFRVCRGSVPGTVLPFAPSGGANGRAPHNILILLGKMVPVVRIGLTTYPLPRGCATTTLHRHLRRPGITTKPKGVLL